MLSAAVKAASPVFFALLFAYVLSQFYRAFVTVVAGDLSRDLGLDSAGLSSLPGTWFLAFALAQFPVGVALDRFGPRRTLVVGMSLAVVGAAWLSVARGLPGALGAMALLGLGCSPVLMAGFYLIGRTYPLHRFAALSSLFLGLGSLGDPLSGFPLALAAEAFGWRPTMAAMAAVTATSVGFTALFLRDPPPAPAPPGRASLAAGIVDVLAIRPLRWILPVTFVSYATVITTRGVWIGPYLETVHGLDLASRSLAATGMGLALASGALLYIPLVRLLDGPKRTVFAGLGAAGLAWLGLGLFGHGSASFAVALLILIGMLGAPFAIVMAHGRSFLPAHVLGLGVTFLNLVAMGGVAAFQFVSGQFVHRAELAGLDPATFFGRLFLGFGLAVGAALIVYVAGPRERRQAG